MQIEQNDRAHYFIGMRFTKDDFEYAQQYITAFNLLYHTEVANNKLSMPMLFLLYHYFELMLKYNIINFIEISGSDFFVTKLNKTHNLSELKNAFYHHWNKIKEQYPELLYKKDKTAEVIYHKKLDYIVDILDDIDNGSGATRFFNNKNGKPSIEDKNVNLHELKDLTDNLAPYLKRSIDILKECEKHKKV